MSAFLALLKALPEVLAIIKALQVAAKQAETERTVKSDLKALHEAIQTKDVSALNALMNK